MITLESLSQSPFSFDLAELNDKTLQRKIYDYKKCIADKFNAWKSSSKQQLVFNKYLAECEDQIDKAINSSGYSELFIKLLLEMFIHLNNEDSAISLYIISVSIRYTSLTLKLSRMKFTQLNFLRCLKRCLKMKNF